MQFPDLTRFPVVSIDTETTGTDWTHDKVFGVSVSTPDGADYYYDVRETPKALEWLADQAPRIPLVVNHNTKFDIHMLMNENVFINTNKIECTMINACLIDEHLRQYNLDAVAKKYLGSKKVDDIYPKLANMFGGEATRKAQMPNLHRAPSEIVAPYAKMDTRLALDLYFWQKKEMERQELEQVKQSEYRLFPFVVRMERNGIRIDVDRASRTKDQLLIRAKEINSEIDRIAGFPVNPNPSQSIHSLFKPVWKPKADGTGYFQCADGTIVPKTPAGKPSLGADQLRAMKHPAAAKILECRKLKKTANTFIEAHLLNRLVGDRVHPNINQTKGEVGDGELEGTGTGRISYTRPALQQIPSRDRAVAEIVRPVFLPEEGHGWSYGDLDQHEYRVFAHYSNAPRLIQAYKDNPDLDIHQAVADLTGLPRSAKRSGQANAKQVNLGMVFCMGGGLLAEKMGLPFTWEEFTDRKGEVHRYRKAGPEAQAVMDRYYEIVPGVRRVARQATSIAKSRGYVRTMGGRHIRFPNGEFTHKASGLIYQGTSADFNKEDICRACEYLDSECPEARFLLNIHDEFSMSFPMDGFHVKHLKEIKAEIERRPELRVPIRVDFSELGANWWEATEAPKCTK